jgi:glutathione synthase
MKSGSRKLGVVMDPISEIKPRKDTTLAMLLEAQRRGWSLFYMELADLHVRDGEARARMRGLSVADDDERWFEWSDSREAPLHDLDIVLMRKDPPFDMEYVYATYILERAQMRGTLILNSPAGLRDVNEKAYTAWFPQCCPANLITRSIAKLREFLDEHEKVVVKPLDVMGGQSIFLVRRGDLNTNVIFEVMTANGESFVQAQSYIPEIVEGGDKRILLIDGEPVEKVLARIPPPGDARGNMAVGGTTEGRELSDRDRWICEQVGPVLQKKGLIFAGLDVIGDYMTEVNVTSPTGIRELDRMYGLNIAGLLFDTLETRLSG